MESGVVSPGICRVCHQAVLPTYYFCPNCGTELHPRPLSTSLEAQIKVYLHSIILPMIVFITISKWQGYKYYKSDNPEAKQIGVIAIALIVFSTLILCWFAYVWTQDAIQSSVNSINADMSI